MIVDFLDQFWIPGNGISLRNYTLNVDFGGHKSDPFWAIYSMPRAYVFWGVDNESFKKNHPHSHPGNARKQWENKPFRATAPTSKKPTPGDLTIIHKSAKTRTKINDLA